MSFELKAHPALGMNQASSEDLRTPEVGGIVHILDSDAETLSRLTVILESSGMMVVPFRDPASLLSLPPPPAPCCLIMDTDLGVGLHGIDIHSQLIESGWRVPTLFLSAYEDVRVVVQAMRNGADDYLTKPFDTSELVTAVFSALEHSSRSARDGKSAVSARTLVSKLTIREREVARLVLSGLLNKEIADKLSIALVTVKVHRGRVMSKLGAGNPAEFAYIATLGGIEPA